MSGSEGIQEIKWRDWNEGAFAAARNEEKPVLLTLGATWCHWCHVMDQTSYSDERVIGLVNSRFIPVRVDVDQRPDISLRYNQGGFPSVAFITGTGEFITGRPYTPPDEMVTLLQQVASGEVPQESRESLAQTPAAEGRDAAGSVGAVHDRLLELYDAEFGGFGVEPKQPPWRHCSFSPLVIAEQATAPCWIWSRLPSRGCARHLRPEGRRILSILGQQGLEGAALRKDAGEQCQPCQGLPGRVPAYREGDVPSNGRGNTALPAEHLVQSQRRAVPGQPGR